MTISDSDTHSPDGDLCVCERECFVIISDSDTHNLLMEIWTRPVDLAWQNGQMGIDNEEFRNGSRGPVRSIRETVWHG